LVLIEELLLKYGDTFLMAVPPNYDCPHLYCVISDPAIHGGIFHIVNLTTDLFRAGKDCVLEVGEHPWITKNSYVSFGDAMEITLDSARKIQALIGTKVKLQQPLQPETLKKIKIAAATSKAFPIKFKRYL